MESKRKMIINRFLFIIAKLKKKILSKIQFFFSSIFYISLPVFLYNSKNKFSANEAISFVLTINSPNNPLKIKFIQAIGKICAAERRMPIILNTDLVKKICADDIFNILCDDYKIVESIKNDYLVTELCNKGIFTHIFKNYTIFKALLAYDIIGGIRNKDDLLLKICSHSDLIRIFGCRYNASSRSDKYYGFFGKLIGAYEICKAVYAWSDLDKPKLLDLKDRHKGKRGFIICNGPSLIKTDFAKLNNEITIGTNGLYLNFDETGFKPTYYIVEDDLVAEDRKDDLNAIVGPVKLFAQRVAYCLKRNEDVIFLRHSPAGNPWADEQKRMKMTMPFSPDLSVASFGGNTVTYTCMQLAFHLGIREVYIIGADHNYKVPNRYDDRNTNENYVIESQEDDENHFNPNYFGKGFRWHNPKVHLIENAYHNAKIFFEHHGGKIYNATEGGCLEVFERVNFSDLF